jgi:ketosteroid isomerase-like protein
MTAISESEIADAESRLRVAMLNSDLPALNALLAPELMFTNHFGQLRGKDDDLAAHRSGKLKIDELIPSEQHIGLVGGVAIVSVRMQLKGSYDGNPAHGDFRFTRVWALSAENTWRVVAAHAGLVS